MTDEQAKTWFHVFVTAVYSFPILGAILSDAFLGKYRTIMALSIVYCLGHLTLAIDDTRAGLGAIQNRFDSTITNLNNVAENLSAARSRILDADFAQETAALTRNQILQQAGLSILAQANQSQQSVLALLG